MPRKLPLPEIGLSLVVLAVSVLFAELYLRRFHPVHGALYALHPRYLHTLVPGARRLFVHQVEDGGRALLVKVNDDGFLGPPLAHRPGRKRVVVYGDSFVAGEFSPEDERFTARLAEHLKARGPAVEVINAGVVGYGPDQAALRLEDEIPRLRPDLVVMAVFAGNDFGDLLRNRVFALDPEGRLVQRAPRPSARLREQFARATRRARGSQLIEGLRELVSGAPRAPHELLPHGGYAFLLQRRQRELVLATTPGHEEVEHLFGDPYDADVSLAPRSDSARYKLALMERVLDRIAEIAASHRLPLVFLYIPSAYDVGEGFPHPDPQQFREYHPSALTDALALAAEKGGWPYLDLYPLYHAARTKRLYFRNDEHWNARGQDLGAAQLAALVRARGLLEHRQ